ncbi:MAG: septum formation initiator family protein [Lachnospiraceae bacterium]|nr:septum formation initiator family protein [Lachnospiraceae bacterium]
MTIILLVALVGAVIVTKNSGDNKTLIVEKDTKIEELKRQIEYEEERNRSLKEKQNYVPYEDYIEDIARNELGLIKDDEIILRPNKE